MGVVVVLLAAFISTPLTWAAEESKVIIKDQDFSPSELTINKGQTVSFDNQDQVDHWPASNPHPTHINYPEFDPQRSLKPGQSWSFKFERVGVFKYHDHLNPHLGGVVLIKEASSSGSVRSKNNFSFDFESVKAYLWRIYYFFLPQKLYPKLQSFNAFSVSQDEKQLKYWLIILGGAQFMDKLVQDSEGGSKVDCHQEAHLVGRLAYDLYKSAVFRKINYSCHSGYIHGAMEAFIKEQGKDNRLMKKLANLCNDFKTDFAKFECLHGIGHGLTAYVNYDIPKALNWCHELPSDYVRRSCFGGVFMENIMVAEGRGAIRGHNTAWVSDDPQFPCNHVEQSQLIQFECYQMQTSRMLSLFKYDFRRIVLECLRAPANMVNVCFRSMGRDIAGQTLRDPDGIINLCGLSPPNLLQECLTGGLNVIVDFWGEEMTDQPQKFCNKIGLPQDKAYCFQVLGERLKNVFGSNVSKIDSLCKKADPLYYQTCLSSLHKS